MRAHASIPESTASSSGLSSAMQNMEWWHYAVIAIALTDTVRLAFGLRRGDQISDWGAFVYALEIVALLVALSQVIK